MIARIWHGTVPTSKSSKYLRLMRTVAIPDYKSLADNRGAFALHRIEGENAHFIMLTYSESREAIAQFAGEDIDLAKYYDFDSEFLSELERLVKHFEMREE